MDKIHGIVSKGMGEGAFFMSMPHYKKELKKALGFESYPGTLNIITNQDWKAMLRNKKELPIAGYEKDGKILGSASCYLARFMEIDGAIIIPKFNKHKNNVVEFIAPFHIKTKTGIKDGDEADLWLK